MSHWNEEKALSILKQHARLEKDSPDCFAYRLESNLGELQYNHCGSAPIWKLFLYDSHTQPQKGEFSEMKDEVLTYLIKTVEPNLENQLLLERYGDFSATTPRPAL